MRKYILSILSSVLFFAPVISWAQNSLLWKISGNGLPEASYLYGTIHIIPAKDYFLPTRVDSVLKASKKLVMEMDLSDPTLQLKVMGAMMMDSGKTLKDLYTEKEYKFLVKKLEKEYGLPMAMMQALKPIMIQQSLMMKDMVGGDFKSYEKEFMETAVGKNIPIAGLETLDDQIAALGAMPVAEQAKVLLDAVKKPKEGKKQLEKLIEVYKKQDVEELYKSISDPKAKLDKYEDDLLTKRNKNWIPKITELAQDGTIFVAVGAAHLGGDMGVINLLRKAGFSVEPVLTKN